MKIVVFDLDETLGSFVEFGIFWDCLLRYLSKTSKKYLTQTEFDMILDLYPEFLRPNIIEILNYLKNKKQCSTCKKLMIYTNNQGSRSWVSQLKKYFETKINYALFDQIIAAFKINGKRIEICRTSNDKSYHDFIRCTKIPLHAEVCFIDDNYFPGMYNENVYYINLKPYSHDIPFDSMIDRFTKSDIGKNMILLDNNNNEKPFFLDFMKEEFKHYNYECIDKTKEEQNIDEIISKQIIVHLDDFFGRSLKTKTKKTKTKRSNMYKRNRTHRNF
jgi:FMN phosphatase YigB (HAD superfamily)